MANTCIICGDPSPCPCQEKVKQFVKQMYWELVDNKDKGGRKNWLGVNADDLMNQIHEHVSKLQIAYLAMRKARPTGWDKPSPELVKEFAADTANLCMMLLDNLGLI